MNNSFVIKAMLACITYFAPIAPLIHVVVLFIFLDWCFGMYASIKNKETIVSHRLRKTIEKFACYTMSIITAYIFQVEIMSWLSLTNLVAGFIAAIELLSIYENIKLITGLDIATRIKDYIMSQIDKLKK